MFMFMFVVQDSIPTFDSWLQMVSGPLLASLVAAMISLVIEYWPEYQNLDKRWKKLSFLAMCLVVGIGSVSLRALLGYVEWSFDPLIWYAVWNAIAAFGIGTIAHEFLPKSK